MNNRNLIVWLEIVRSKIVLEPIIALDLINELIEKLEKKMKND